jgi:hypothetical protein
MGRILTFVKSLIFHIYSGLPKSTQEYGICLSCDSFDNQNSQCLECGCNINNKRIFMNKLAWADQECPLNKWSKIQRKS